MRRFLFGWVACLAACAVAASCGGGSHFGNDAGGDASIDGLGDDNPINFGDTGSKDGSCATTHCSSDLHDVLCDDNSVVQTCPPDQGCAGGTCVAACDSASANKTTIGCDYWTLYPDMYSSDEGDCLGVYIANTWGSPVTVSVEYNNVPLTNIAQAARLPQGSGQSITYQTLPNGQIPADQVAILFLAGTPSAPVTCPAGITPLMTTDPATHGTGIGKAFHITTSAPVVGYQIYPYGGGNSAITSATLLIPTPAWDTNYIGVDAYNNVGPWLVIMAATDNTVVKFTPTSAVSGGNGVPTVAVNQLGTITLNKGQYAQIDQPSGSELNGTAIQATNPIAVFGGDTCMDVPQTAGACDAAHQQIPPVKALGHEYVGVKHRDRYTSTPETPPWRLVGAVAGTTLTWEPSTPTGAPTTLNAGQMVEFASGGPFVVKSQDDQHPFYMAQYMTGCTAYWGSTGDCRGDPEFVNMIPPQQYLDSYVLFTDPTYSETELVVTREKGQNGFEDVTLDCVGTLPQSGQTWQAVGTSGTYQTTRVDLVTGNFAKVGNCDNGRHTMSSNGIFGVTVWGWGSAATGGSYRCTSNCSGFYTQAVSYGYPAGASVQPINTVVVVPTPH